MKKLVFTFLTLCLSVAAFAQINPENYPLIPIDSVQFRTSADLNAFNATPADCKDASLKVGDTVKVTGKVVMDGGTTVTQPRSVWIMQDTLPWKGIHVIAAGSSAPVTTPAITDLEQGDSVVIVGTISEYDGETQLTPLHIAVVDLGKDIHFKKISNVGVFNNTTRINNLATGEQWEGMYVELKDLEVVSVDPFGNNTRFSFTVKDNAGNRINISDWFRLRKGDARRLQRVVNGSPTIGPFGPDSATFSVAVGDKFNSIKGIIKHSRNGGGNCGNGRGYELHPFMFEHYDKASSAPNITTIAHAPLVPSSTQNITVTITATASNPITAVTLFYGTGSGSTNYTSVAMTDAGNGTYTATIPAQSEGTFVRYYARIQATDASTSAVQTANRPNVPGGAYPLFFVVRNNGLTIRDIQFTPYPDGRSGYENKEVTVSGVVTASAATDNLGSIFIQQRGQVEWAGIMITGSSPALLNLNVGDSAQFTGTVREWSHGASTMTRLVSASLQGASVPVAPISPLTLDEDIFSTYEIEDEAYEGMLVRFELPNRQLVVVDTNADAPSNFGEWRIGKDIFAPNTGCRVLTGRRNANAFGSRAVSYVNRVGQTELLADLTAVSPILVNIGDSIQSITGLMYHSFANMKLLPRNNADVVVTSTSLKKAIANIPVSVYPNPAQNSLFIEVEPKLNGYYSANLIDLSGKSILKRNITENRTKLNVNHLQNGYYILVISDENGDNVARQKVAVIK